MAACYLSAVGIDSLERIRRNMNRDPEALPEDLRMIRQFDSRAGERRAKHKAGGEAIKRTDASHNLAFTERLRYGAGYIGQKPPSLMTLIDKCASRQPGIGVTCQRLLRPLPIPRRTGCPGS